MATSEPTLYARMELRLTDAEKKLAKFQGTVNQTTGAMETRTAMVTKKIEQHWDKVGTSAANAAFQQRNFQMQLADVGQSLALGMSPLQVLLQQGPQIAQIYGPGGLGKALQETASALVGLVGRFAPLIAVIALAYGAYKILASNTVAAKNAVSEATKALADQAAPLGSVKGLIEDLGDAQNAYATAVGDTATKQVAASNTIIAATKKEFEAKRQLFELELERQKASLDVQRAAITQLGNDVRGRIGETVFTRDDSIRQGTSDPLVGDFTINADRLAAVQKTMDLINADPATKEIKKLSAELTLAELSTNRMDEALKKAWKGGFADTDEAANKTKNAGHSMAAAANEATDAWEGLRTVSDEVKKSMEAAEQAMKDSIQTQKDIVNGALSDMRTAIEDGKITWDEWGDIAVNALNKVADRLQTMAVDSLFSSGGLPFLTQLLAGGATAVAGGGTGAGGTGVQQSGLKAPGSSVRPAAAQAAMASAKMVRPSMLRVGKPGANGGGQAPVKVTVINNTPAQVRTEERDDGQGGRNVTFVLEEQVASAITRPGSAANKAMRSNFGVSQRLVKR
jgi:hypothetical protein